MPPLTTTIVTVLTSLLVASPISASPARSPQSAPLPSYHPLLLRDYPGRGFHSPAFQSTYGACTNASYWGASATYHDHLSPYRYIHENPQLCAGHVDLLIAVHSFPGYWQRRQAIRNTWGSLRIVKNMRVAVAFFHGSGVSAEHQRLVDEESRHFGDIVQLDFVESYKNLSLKHLSVMHWTLRHCSQVPHLLKVDDDTFVDIFHVALFLSEYPPKGFVCRAVPPRPPYRWPTSKWYISEKEYPLQTYPSYCEGFAYLLNARLVRDLYWCSTFTKYMWIDDVFVSGILSERLGVQIDNFLDGHTYDNVRPSHVGDEMLDYMFLRHGGGPFFKETSYQIWAGVLHRQTIFV